MLLLSDYLSASLAYDRLGRKLTGSGLCPSSHVSLHTSLRVALGVVRLGVGLPLVSEGSMEMFETKKRDLLDCR